MFKHHEETIQNTIAYFQKEPDVVALILGGSVAHGFAGIASDIDVMIVVSDQNYAMRLSAGHLQFWNKELATYDDGYVDGKYMNMDFLRQVDEKGSEPARFAFQDAKVLYSRGEPLDERIRSIARYPVEQKADRLRRFYVQFEVWNWYVSEALKQNNRHLLTISISKLVLFGGRLILAHNELLYPYHKWFMRVLASAKEKPPVIISCIETLYQTPSAENARIFYELIKNFRDWGKLESFSEFLIDSELNWMTGSTPIDDI
jgi:hypothetical protein